VKGEKENQANGGGERSKRPKGTAAKRAAWKSLFKSKRTSKKRKAIEPGEERKN